MNNSAILDNAKKELPHIKNLFDKYSKKIESDRRLPDDLVTAVSKTGIFDSMIPLSGGGREWKLPVTLRVIEELSKIDGSIGWMSGVGGAVSGVTTGWLPSNVIRALFGKAPLRLVSASTRPSGIATSVPGGISLSGKWQFASSVSNARLVLGGFHLEDEIPKVGLIAIFKPNELEILDTWSVLGMHGTGSHDFVISNLFVPQEHTLDYVDGTPKHDGPLYRMQPRFTLITTIAPLALGMARTATEYFKDFMSKKQDSQTGTPMLDRSTLQERFAKAEIALRSARAFFYDTIDNLWDIIERGDQPTDKEITVGRLAVTNAVTSGTKVIDILYHSAGSSSFYKNNLLERYFRDIHVVAQHGFATDENLYHLGANLLEDDSSDVSKTRPF